MLNHRLIHFLIVTTFLYALLCDVEPKVYKEYVYHFKLLLIAPLPTLFPVINIQIFQSS